MIKNVNELRDIAQDYTYEIIKDYVHLKRKGNTYLGLCPFHNEKTPSFRVNHDKGFYKCFGCGQGGDAIQFLMDHEGMTFPEALEHVGRIAKLKVEYAEIADRQEELEKATREKQRRDDQAAQMKYAWDNYQYQGLPATDFEWIGDKEAETLDKIIKLDGREWRLSTLQKFQIGYAPKNSYLSKIIQINKLDETIFAEIGIVKKGDHGTYDFFRERILFPIRDHLGKIVGLAGRKMQQETRKEVPKYLNSPESYLYRKDEVLYGLFENRVSIKDAGYATLLEGYTDVMRMWEAGLQTGVASCGTAFTEKQARHLGRFTKKILILRDGDQAGYEAAKRDVLTAISSGLQPMVCLLPDDEDPDSYITQHGAQAMAEYIDKHKEDGLIWRVMEEWHTSDPFKQEQAVLLAAEMLAEIESEFIRNDYIRKLTTKSRLGDNKRILKDAINKTEDKKVREGKKKLSPQQAFDAQNFGVYEANNKYWKAESTSGLGFEISNFVIKPIMLIRARDESRRLIEIVNENGHTHIIDIDSKTLSSFERFSDHIEGLGNFMYNEFADKKLHIKIKKKVYAVTPTCYPIYTMGLHKEGFYTWGNGILKPDGKFVPVDEFGLVSFNDTKFFLKAHSKIDQSIMSDDDENTMADQTNFCYIYSGKTITLKDITKRMVDIHGQNAMVAISWLFAAIFRDFIYQNFNFFPHLNHFGPPGAGKSFLAWNIMHFFGATPKAPFHLVHGTDAAFFRTLSWVRNGVVWFDEYKNEVRFERIEALKAAYDGAGREKAKGGYGHSVTRTPVNSGCLITGQEQPIQDPALYSRCVSLSFPKKELSEDQIEQGKQLEKLMKTGQLTQLIGHIMRHREFVMDGFQKEFDDIRRKLRSELQQEELRINDRVVMNYAITLAMAKLIGEKEVLAFTYDDLYEFSYSNMLNQMDSMSTQDEVGVFWTIVEFMLANFEIRHESDVKIEMRTKEKFRDEEDRSNRKDTKEIIFPEEKKLIYLSFTRVHPMYQERMQRSKRTNGLDLEALKYYLRCSEGYVGEKRAKKFGKTAKPCYVFDVEQLTMDFPLSIEAMIRSDDQDDDDQTDATLDNGKDDDIPF